MYFQGFGKKVLTNIRLQDSLGTCVGGLHKEGGGWRRRWRGGVVEEYNELKRAMNKRTMNAL